MSREQDLEAALIDCPYPAHFRKGRMGFICICENECTQRCKRNRARFEKQRKERARLRLDHFAGCAACEYEKRLLALGIKAKWMSDDIEWLQHEHERPVRVN